MQAEVADRSAIVLAFDCASGFGTVPSLFAGATHLRPICRTKGAAGLALRTINLVLIVASVISLAVIGCATNSNRSALPGQKQLVLDQLVIHSDFHLPRHHRLLEELTVRRKDISELLDIPTSDEPINVFLFEDEQQFRSFMTEKHPEFPNRRAFFVKNDTSLNVYAFWGSRVGEDLRHEVTHGYLHSVVPNVPLWLDEGIAEYFEVGRGKGGLNGPHVYQLSNSFQRGEWKPDLARLESLEYASQLTQQDYAESWLWVHFLLTGDSQTRSIIRDHLQGLIDTGMGGPILPQVKIEFPDCESQLVTHLKSLEARR